MKYSLFYFSIGLTCYACDTDGSGPDCIDNPNKYQTVPCGKNEAGDVKDYCYTRRMEVNNPETGELGKLLIFSEILIRDHKTHTFSLVFKMDCNFPHFRNHRRSFMLPSIYGKLCLPRRVWRF